MSYAVVYSSNTGNTTMLAECVKSVLPAEELIYFGTPAPEALQADIIFVGSWTDKGTCSSETGEFLKKLNGKQVYIFGTAGFGGDPGYFTGIGERMAKNLPADSTLLGCYICQGKMPRAVRSRYEAMAEKEPEKAKPMLDNFDRALSHPDRQDLEQLEKEVLNLLKRI